MVVKVKQAQLEKIAALVAEGRVKVEIGKVFPLQKAGDAQKYLENAHVRGKVLLKTARRGGSRPRCQIRGERQHAIRGERRHLRARQYPDGGSFRA